MKCRDCKFYSPSGWPVQEAELKLKGNCRLELPPMLQQMVEGYSTFTTHDSGCDLGQPEEAKDNG
jgi:hypothetical protein